MTTVRTLVGSMLVGVSIGACSHSSPYVRDPVPPDAFAAPPAERVLQRVVLIGDAGEPRPEGEPVLESLRDTVANLPERTVVVFLGDNVYPAGLPAEGAGGRPSAEAALNAQIEAVGSARGIFIPGNHDWQNSYEGGLATILRQDFFLSERPRVELSPTGGCPGPVAHELDGVRLVALDTQWWLHAHEKGGPTCSYADTAAALRGLEQMLEAPPGTEVVVLGHHPLRSQGPHNGFYTAAEWVFPSLMSDSWVRWVLLPLPLLGPAVRWVVRSDQDFGSTGNRALREQLDRALRTRPPLAYASGHEHSLQVFDGTPTASLLLVSGLGSSAKETPVGDQPTTLFAHAHPGFMVLDFLETEVLLRVVEPGEDGGVVFAKRIRRSGAPQ